MNGSFNLVVRTGTQCAPCRMLPVVALLLAVAFSSSVWATLVPRMALEEMADGAALIVHGRVTRTWTGWDSSRQFIWTHYEIQTTESLKGGAQAKVVVSEPGGMVGEMSMQIAGAPRYSVGNEVILFLARTPIGYLRTYGWGQGKFTVSDVAGSSRQTVSAALPGVTLIEAAGKPGVQPRFAGTAPGALDGLELREFKSRLKLLIEARASKEGR